MGVRDLKTAKPDMIAVLEFVHVIAGSGAHIAGIQKALGKGAYGELGCEEKGLLKGGAPACRAALRRPACHDT